MNRLARVIAQGRHSVTLQLQKTEKCAGCTGNCNKPLFNLFSMKTNVFILNPNQKKYQINDQDRLLSQKLPLGYLIGVHISEHDLYKYSGLLYLFPLLLCVIMLSVGHYVGKWLGLPTDLTALMGLFLGFAMVYLMMRVDLLVKYLKIRPVVTILDKQGTKGQINSQT